jgi:hypothetical protein
LYSIFGSVMSNEYVLCGCKVLENKVFLLATSCTIDRSDLLNVMSKIFDKLSCVVKLGSIIFWR